MMSIILLLANTFLKEANSCSNKMISWQTEARECVCVCVCVCVCSVVSNSLRPHESQHVRPPCPSPTPAVHSDSHPFSQWCHPAISSSVVAFSSCPQALQYLNLDKPKFMQCKYSNSFLQHFYRMKIRIKHGGFNTPVYLSSLKISLKNSKNNNNSQI